MGSKLRLVIKAASGSVDDFRIEAETDWTVRQLKTHLYRQYPTHPPLSSQRLIHSGQLLLDQQLLRQLPNFQDEALVIHLVAFERSVSAPAMVSNNRKTTSSSQPSLSPVEENEGQVSEDDQLDGDGTSREQETTPQVQPETPPTSSNQPHPPPADPRLRYRGPQPEGEGIYAPYMHHLPMMQGGVVMGGAYPGFPPPPQFAMPAPHGPAYPNQQMAQWYHNYYGRPATAGVQGETERDDLYDPQILEDPDQARNDENDEERAMNAGALGLMGGANFQHRRDFVDYLYMLMMAGFLALVAFITGSFGRLLIFFAGVIFMLLNQAGWFSLQRRPVAVPVAANEVAPPPEPQIRQEQQAGAVVQEGPPNETEDNSQETPVPEPSATQESDQPPPVPVPDQPLRNEPDRPGLAMTIFVFVTSFFSSLVPQRPEFQAN